MIQSVENTVELIYLQLKIFSTIEIGAQAYCFKKNISPPAYFPPLLCLSVCDDNMSRVYSPRVWFDIRISYHYNNFHCDKTYNRFISTMIFPTGYTTSLY